MQLMEFWPTEIMDRTPINLGDQSAKDAEITIDFGREVELDKLGLVLRADFPHDSYWKQVTIAFSDGSEEIFTTSDAIATQYFTFSTNSNDCYIETADQSRR